MNAVVRRTARARPLTLTEAPSVSVGIALVSMVIAVAVRAMTRRRDYRTVAEEEERTTGGVVFSSMSERRFRSWLLERSLDRTLDLHATHNSNVLINELALSTSAQQLIRRADRARNHLLDSHRLAIYERRIANETHVYAEDSSRAMVPFASGNGVEIGFRSTDRTDRRASACGERR